MQDNNWEITTKNGKDKLPLFCGNGKRVIPIYVSHGYQLIFQHEY